MHLEMLICKLDVGLRRSQCVKSPITTNAQAMMTSSNGNIFRVTGPLCGEFTGRRWIPLTETSDAGCWYFLWSPPEETVK